MRLLVTGISGSPRVDGNTDTILHEALTAAKNEGAEVQLIRLADYRLEPCDACGTCHETKNCAKKDDWEKLYQEVLRSDGVILGSPSYFQGTTAQMKTFIDRMGYLSLARGRKDFAGKVGGVIGIARRSGLENVCSQLMNFVTATRMIVPSGGRVFGLAREKGEILKDQEALDSARYLGKMMAKTIEATEGVRKS
jgi:multimeric flavodoxin WrbA